MQFLKKFKMPEYEINIHSTSASKNVKKKFYSICQKCNHLPRQCEGLVIAKAAVQSNRDNYPRLLERADADNQYVKAARVAADASRTVSFQVGNDAGDTTS